MMCLLGQRKKMFEKGFSLVELLVVLSLTSILLGFGVYGVHQLVNPAISASEELVTLLKVVRSKAISNTVAYKLEPSGSNRLVASYRAECVSTDPWKSDGQLTLNLPSGAYLSSNSWVVCYDTRGFPDANVVFDVRESGGKKKTIEIYLGGGLSVS